MPFDQPTRNLLARFVGDARTLLTEEFTRQLQQEYGLDPERGEATDLDRLGHLDDARRATALLLRETLAYYLAGQPKPDAKARREALDRIVREQAFTILNRLCALRMAEGRGLLIESVGQGHRSRGFQLYGHLAGTGLGETGDAYRCYLLSLFDELALELPVLFDRYAPEGRLFPREVALSQVLALINAPEIAPLWAEDETIGWIYQYFNSVEERRQMRAESAAPRNSRELAVRNQFFTPRYVVEFLTDNTLGRIWYEMRRGETDLKESCRYLVRRPTEIFLAAGEEAPQQDQRGDDPSQEELLRQPVYIPHRPLKDPRNILMLDPACGSLHFGLYAFDLYERIYDEAWELEGILGADAFTRSEGLRPLRESYPDKAAFLADVPRLIIERDIHGIDIDPRAVQIAGLSLWLRAQRSWQAQGIKPQDRPQIRRSNIVCAEPMPGDRALLEEFLKTLRDERLEGLIRRVLKTPAHQRVRATPAMADALCDLVRTVWKEMELAGEAGSLLKIEEALEDAVVRGKAAWDEKAPLFRVVDFGLTGQADAKPKIRYAKSIPGEEATDFWDRAEALVLAALEEYAEGAGNGGGYRRRLFVGDAARGFAFIDLCRRFYDVVVMNPPFGEPTIGQTDYIGRCYPNAFIDLLAAFVERATGLCRTGRIGALTSRACLYTKTLATWRKERLLPAVEVLADLGGGVLDGAMVFACASVFGLPQAASPICIAADLRTASVRDSSLRTTTRRLAEGNIAQNEYITLRSKLFGINGFRFVYNIPDAFWKWSRSSQTLADAGGFARAGGTTYDDFRFLRLAWEVPTSELRWSGTWVFFSKGGYFETFYNDVHLVVNWRNGGREVGEFNRIGYGTDAQSKRSSTYYRKAGVTYPRRTIKGFCPRSLPVDCIFADKGPLVCGPKATHPSFLLGYLNSAPIRSLIHLQIQAGSFETGIVNTIPWLETPSLAQKVSQLAVSIWADKASIYRWWEVDRSFVPFALRSVLSIASLFEQIRAAQERKSASAVIQCRQISDLVRQANDLPTIDYEAFEVSDDDHEIQDDFGIDGVGAAAFYVCQMALGFILGRWNIDYALGKMDSTEPSDPFGSLAACPPGMLQTSRGMPAFPGSVASDYPLRISWSGILPDDMGHVDDIERRVQEVLVAVWGNTAEDIERESVQSLQVSSLREFFARPNLFFAEHLGRYSKSRRQAPIYWPLSTPSGSYTLWLYYHRLTDQTLYTCVNDFVDPKLAAVSSQLAVLRRKSGRSREEERELEQLTDLETELKDFRAELLRIAAFWKPNLNDGVQITAAPLWRLFQHRPWQKTLKETWEKLEAGEYAWAHLAMSIWPERVVPKCVTDRSLAIAHDVEELFWVEDGGRWRNLNPPDEELAEQKRRQQRPGRQRLRDVLGELARGRARGLRGIDVWDELAAGRWDDLEASLLLWPERVAAKCWDDPLLAVTLKLDLPTKRTKAARDRFVKERTEAGCPDLAAALEETLRDRPDRFASIWAELARGDRDELALALALWPERVVDKCARDVELAERHGVRRFLWVQIVNGVWRRRKATKEEVRDEVERRQRKGA